MCVCMGKLDRHRFSRLHVCTSTRAQEPHSLRAAELLDSRIAGGNRTPFVYFRLASLPLCLSAWAPIYLLLLVTAAFIDSRADSLYLLSFL